MTFEHSNPSNVFFDERLPKSGIWNPLLRYPGLRNASGSTLENPEQIVCLPLPWDEQSLLPPHSTPLFFPLMFSGFRNISSKCIAHCSFHVAGLDVLETGTSPGIVLVGGRVHL